MGIIIRKRKRLGSNTWLNLGLRGISASRRIGRVTASTSGRVSVRIAPGISWRIK